MPPLDPSKDFTDDGGTPVWRARHAPPLLTVYPTRKAMLRELLHRHPVFCALFPALFLYTSFALLIAGFLIYALVYRLITGHI
jgi:hypothetical protein